MKGRQRVVWFEGMTLEPHHFQQWDRYQQGVVHARFEAMTPHDWGVTELEIDRDRLANGELALVRARGVMPDGQQVDIPGLDAPPAPRAVQEHFPAAGERVAVHLVLPAEQQGAGNVALQGGNHRREARFAAETAVVVDDNTGVDERSIEVARPNFGVRFGTEPLAAYTSLPLAEVVRGAGGVFALDERYVPPCLNLRASERLQTVVRRTLELLVAKSSSLAERRAGIVAQRELTPADVTTMQQLGVVNTFIPQFHHFHRGAGAHPERLYETLAALAGQLSAWVAEVPVHPRELPAYRHDTLSDCFNPLEQVISTMLGDTAPRSNYVQFPLRRQRENLYVVDVEARLLREARLFLVVNSDQFAEHRLVEELPQMLRVASPNTIDAVLRSYTRALTIEHTHRLPSGMPVDGQALYFQLQKRGPFWEAIVDNGALALFVPEEFGTVNYRLIAVE